MNHIKHDTQWFRLTARPKPARRGGGAFTLIELLVVISIIALLVGILLPALGAARESARKAVSLSNSRQIGVAIYSYTADNDDFYPIYKARWVQAPYRAAQQRRDAAPLLDGTDGFWWTSKLVLEGYLPGPQAFNCPSFEVIPPTDKPNLDLDDMTAGESPGDTAYYGWNMSEYGYNAYFLGSGLGLLWKNTPAFRGVLGFSPSMYLITPRTSDVDKPSDTITLTDSRDYANETRYSSIGQDATFGVGYLFPRSDPPNRRDQYGFADPRHKSAVNVFWTDGHGDSFSVVDPDEPYGQDELTDAGLFPLNNKWDLQ